MPNNYFQPFYKQFPITRLLVGFVLGILLQYHLSITLLPFLVVFIISLIALLLFQTFHLSTKYKLIWFSGCCIVLLFFAMGGMLSYTKNIENSKKWIGKFYQPKTPVKLTLQEPIAVKQNSYKALAKADAVLLNNEWQQVNGDLLLYFKKDSTLPNLYYGSQIIVTSNLMPIINAGNPGGFNYAEYCKFQNISFQAFLKDDDFVVMPTTNKNFFDNALIKTRETVLAILRKNINGKNELSVAEALLIGYRDDLDRDLVQTYSNTGVVHIIAISGLHLGMIYWLLLKILIPFAKRKWLVIVKPIVILFVLWGFTFVAGAAPSILRSAVMFTFIVVGETFDKRVNILNSLAASAFLLLAINPFSLWDVGFQLSYTAVLSIVIFHGYINKWFYFKNKLLQYFWSLNALSLSAQILTLPIVLYHFHQFPNLFLITNIFAVPFSGLILFAELLLLVVSPLTSVANFVGSFTENLISILNNFIQRMDSLPFAVWQSIQITIPQAILLYAAIITFAIWLVQKNSKYFLSGLMFLLLFITIRSIDFAKRNTQQKLIVYNVPKHTAIDIIEGRNYYFLGDSILTEDGFLRNFHIKPSRVLHRITPTNTINNFSITSNFILSANKKVVIVDDEFEFTTTQKIKTDVVVLTKNPKVELSNLSTIFQCNQYVFDSSNPFYKVEQWNKQADSLHLQHHSTATQGAFQVDL